MATDGFIFSQDGKTLLKCDFSKLGTFVNVPSGVTKIANAVFAEAPVTKVILPDSVTEIGQNLFSSCETLEEVKLPAFLTSLKPFTFAGCSSLRKISMPDNVSSFPEGLFWGCSSLPEIPFRDGIENLETDVCRDCESITSILIPPSVKNIKPGALSGCTNLSTIVFPAELESIADRSLSGLKSLQYMRFSGDSDNFFVDENYGCLYQLTENGAVLIKCPVIVDSVYLVENTCDAHIDAFEGCTLLEEVYASEDAPENLINRLMELIPQIDINSYSDEPSEEEKFASQIEHLGENLDQVQVNKDEFSEIGEFTQNDSDEDDDEETDAEPDMDARLAEIMGTGSAQEEVETDSDAEIQINQNELDSILNQHEVVEQKPETSETEMSEDERIQEILNSQCCRNDALDEGFRPVTMDELEKLMNGPVVDPTVQSEEDMISEPVIENSEPDSEDEPAQIIIEEPIGTEEDAKAGDDFIQSILNDQACRNDALDEGYRPVTMEELEYLMNPPEESESSVPVQNEAAAEDSSEEDKPKKKRTSRKSKKAEETDSALEEKPKRRRSSKKTESSDENSSEVAETEDKPKKKRTSRKSKKTEETLTEAVTSEEPVINEPVIEETVIEEEPRFIKAMKNLAAHQMVLEEDENKIENVYGDLRELLVIADGVAPSTNDFSSHLVKFSKAVAKKYGFTKIYFFEDLPLDNPEFIYGLESFGNFRNVLYACNKPCSDKISTDQKELINAAGISLPASCKIQSVKDKLGDVDLQYPVKILVQDNYIEGLLYCAEKYREDHGIK